MSNSLDTAKKLLKRRKFSLAIDILEQKEDVYEGDFDYYLTFGIACLYMGELGNASLYFRKARDIKIQNTQLLLGQAAIFLQRGEQEKALDYYIDVLDLDPNNSVAKSALEFLRKDGEWSSICKLVDNNGIQRFYPPLGANPDIIRNCVFTGILLGSVLSLLIIFVPKIQEKRTMIGPRANLENLVLSSDESRHAQKEDLSDTVVHYFLDNKEINQSYNNALVYFQNHRDNAAQVEINRLLNSNASLTIKRNCSTLMSYLSVPTFDSLTDNYKYSEVILDPQLYLDCYVSWSGRISNVRNYENASWFCDFLIGYDTNRFVEGIVPVSFRTEPQPQIDGEKPVRFLAQIKLQDNKILLEGRAVYQPLKQ